MSHLYRKFVFPLCVFLAALVCVSCGGEQLAGGGIGGTGITTGTVTGFGSIFVNGVEFETAGASMDIDDVLSVGTGTDDADVLGLGMVVVVTGTVNADGVTGTATSVTYDEIVEGPIAAILGEDLDMQTKTFEVLGITVIADSNTTVFVGTDYLSLAAGRVVEISGFFDASGQLLATRIEDQGVLGGGTVVELRGTVSVFNGVDSFMLGNIKVTFDGTTVFEDLPGTVSDDQFVEVAGTLDLGPDPVMASRIELEAEGFSDSGAISLEGIVTEFSGLGSFRVSGQLVDATAAVFSPASLAVTLENDQHIEVEGEIIAGVLVAVEVEQRQGDITIAGLVVGNVGDGTLGIEVVSGQPITVNTDAQTQLEDEQLERTLTLGDLTPNVDEVVIEGYLDDFGNVMAAQIKRKVLEKYQLQGPVDAASGSASSGSVTILGVTMQTDGITEFEDANDQAFPDGGDDFFSLVSPGDLVKVEDVVPVNGIADEVEFEN